MDLITAAVRLGVALALGSMIGFERQWAQKMAGLRTKALVSLGACGFVVFSVRLRSDDPTRIVAQVVTGIGFLGAGIILREGVNVRDLTRPRHCGVRRSSGLLLAVAFLSQASLRQRSS